VGGAERGVSLVRDDWWHRAASVDQ